ncbi:MAG: archaemetzincin family Zn-dependent metalloprotease [Thermoproteota archaeon]|nr:archaemetzincin family Zn-dependent metalloprotease [Candidatus Brockarchaeota archaeon]
MVYKIFLVSIGYVQENILNEISIGVKEVFRTISVTILSRNVPLPKNSSDSYRQQYNSSIILDFLKKLFSFSIQNKVLGITSVDLFVPELNFVFGEALFGGNVAVISLKRLFPEFYGYSSNHKLFISRAVKEAVHELGHCFGLGHCKNKKCVMHFSNSILDTDIKEKYFCTSCKSKLNFLVKSIT